MKLLLDTHLVLWWEAGHHALPRRAREMIENNDQGVFISRASLWEMAIKLALGRLRMDLNKFVGSIEAQGFQWLDIANSHLLAVSTLPTHNDHRDPFDRLLVAQSLTEPMILLTVDAKLARYGATVRIVG